MFLEKQKQSANAELSTTVLNIKLKRDPVIGFGLSIARGRGAEPYKVLFYFILFRFFFYYFNFSECHVFEFNSLFFLIIDSVSFIF